jgi:hypothetical protein
VQYSPINVDIGIERPLLEIDLNHLIIFAVAHIVGKALIIGGFLGGGHSGSLP